MITKTGTGSQSSENFFTIPADGFYELGARLRAPGLPSGSNSVLRIFLDAEPIALLTIAISSSSDDSSNATPLKFLKKDSVLSFTITESGAGSTAWTADLVVARPTDVS